MENALRIWRQTFPFITAVVVFIVVTWAYLHPMLEGKKLDQHDITMWKGMSKEISDFREKTGEEALWTNSMFGGMPAWQISVIYNGNLIKYVRQVITFGMPYPASTIFIYFLGFYILLLVMRVDPWLSMAGALAFGFSSYFLIILGAGHSSKANAIGYMAPVIAGIILTFRGNYLKGGLLTAFALALQLEANHLQITYYLLLLVVILGLAQLADTIRFKTLPVFAKASGVLLLAAMLATLTHGTNLYATWEYGKESMRGKPVLVKDAGDQTKGLDRSYITNWSYGVGETWSLMIPNAKGGGTAAIGNNHPALENADRNFKQALAQQNAYWGDQPGTSGPVYAGAIVLFLFVIGLFAIKGKYKWILLAGTLLSILLGWGKNFMPFTNFFLDFIPGYDKFRAVSMTLVIAELTIPLLGFLGLWHIYKHPEWVKEKRKLFFAAFGLTGGLSLLFYLAPSMFFSFQSSFELEQFNRLRQSNPAESGQIDLFVGQLEAVRMAIFKKDALRSFFFITLAAGLIYAFAAGKLKQYYLTAALTLLILVDMVGVATRYLNSSDFVAQRKVDFPFTASTANNEILKDKDADFRVLDLTNSTFNDASTSYFHHSIGGYHGAKLMRYQDLIEYHIQPEIASLSSVMKNDMTLQSIQERLAQSEVLNMLNTRYVIFNPQSAPIRNLAAFGDAWPVRQLQFVNTANEEIEQLGQNDLRSTAVVHQEFAGLLGGLDTSNGASGNVALLSYAPNKLNYKASLDKEGLVVFSQVWYTKGWKAFVNGVEQPLIRANYALRALRLPAGTSEVEMRFEPRVWVVGEKVSFMASALLLLLLAAAIYLDYKKQKAAQKA